MLSVFGAGEAAGALQRGPAPRLLQLGFCWPKRHFRQRARPSSRSQAALLPPKRRQRPLASGQPSHPGMRRRPPRRAADAVPFSGKLGVDRRPTRPALPKIITGAQPILPPGFSAYAGFDQ